MKKPTSLIEEQLSELSKALFSYKPRTWLEWTKIPFNTEQIIDVLNNLRYDDLQKILRSLIVCS